MLKTVELKLLPGEAANDRVVKQKLCSKAGIAERDLKDWRIVKRSIDARFREVCILLRIEFDTENKFEPEPSLLEALKPVGDKPRVVIVGAGPAGYFAALELISAGLKPLIFDRGKDVQSRRRDLRAIQQFGT